MAAKLTDKQKLFCKEYIVDLNATRAAKDAGYSKKTANSVGPENLVKPCIQEYIAKLQEKRSDKVEITADDVLREYKLIGISDVKNYFDIVDGELSLKSFEDMSPDISRAIESIKQTKTSTISKKGNEYITLKTEIKLWSKPNALEMISRHTGGFTEKKGIDVKVDLNLTETIVLKLHEVEKAERLKLFENDKNRIKKEFRNN